MVKQKKLVIIYTVLHFLVDFTTVFLVTGILLGPSIGIVNRGAVVITYNLLAFAGQLPIGILSDMINKNRLITAVGCALACISYPVAFIHPWAACVLAAIGNGFFHIGAGSDILKMSMPEAGLSGVFVSSGALAVWLAYRASGNLVIILCPVIMLVSVILIFLPEVRFFAEDESARYYNKQQPIAFIAACFFMITIVIRSFLGTVMNFSWSAVPLLSLLSVLAVVAGKAFGGLLSGRFGRIKTTVVSLTVSSIAFFFAFDYWIAGIIAVLFFNMTMPLTLTAIAGICGKNYGFSFGLTTFALALGTLPIVFGAGKFSGVSLLVSMVLLSLILMVSAYLLLKTKKSDG